MSNPYLFGVNGNIISKGDSLSRSALSQNTKAPQDSTLSQLLSGKKNGVSSSREQCKIDGIFAVPTNDGSLSHVDVEETCISNGEEKTFTSLYDPKTGEKFGQREGGVDPDSSNVIPVDE